MTCLVSFPGRSHSTACPARLNQQTSIEERISGHFGSRHLLRKQTLHRERSAFFRWLGGIWFDILPSFGWDSLLLSAKQCSAMVEQKTKVFMAQNFSLHRSGGGGEEQDTRSRLFLEKVSAPDFSFSFESCLVTCPLIAAVIPSQSKLCISTFTFFLSESKLQIKTLVVASAREAENGSGKHKRSAIESQMMRVPYCCIWAGRIFELKPSQFHQPTYFPVQSLPESPILNISPLTPPILSQLFNHIIWKRKLGVFRKQPPGGNNNWFNVLSKNVLCKCFEKSSAKCFGKSGNILSCCGAGNGFLSVIGIALCLSAVTLAPSNQLELFLPPSFPD